MAQFVYTKGKQVWTTEGLLPTGAEDYRLILLDSTGGYVPNAGHEWVSDVASAELVTPGYSRQSLTGLTVVTNGTKVGLAADMVTYTAVGDSPYPTVIAGVVCRWVTDASDSWLLAYCDSITAVTNGDDLIVTWAVDGIAFI